eukprot:Hpha_TRINITY_DN15557_c4_g2::TRINITY_DN15557_c4_g2_i2::g.104771::m.104771
MRRAKLRSRSPHLVLRMVAEISCLGHELIVHPRAHLHRLDDHGRTTRLRQQRLDILLHICVRHRKVLVQGHHGPEPGRGTAWGLELLRCFFLLLAGLLVLKNCQAHKVVSHEFVVPVPLPHVLSRDVFCYPARDVVHDLLARQLLLLVRHRKRPVLRLRCTEQSLRQEVRRQAASLQVVVTAGTLPSAPASEEPTAVPTVAQRVHHQQAMHPQSGPLPADVVAEVGQQKELATWSVHLGVVKHDVPPPCLPWKTSGVFLSFAEEASAAGPKLVLVLLYSLPHCALRALYCAGLLEVLSLALSTKGLLLPFLLAYLRFGLDGPPKTDLELALAGCRAYRRPPRPPLFCCFPNCQVVTCALSQRGAKEERRESPERQGLKKL